MIKVTPVVDFSPNSRTTYKAVIIMQKSNARKPIKTLNCRKQINILNVAVKHSNNNKLFHLSTSL